MAYWIDPTAKCVGNVKEFYCDDASDIDTMPTSSEEGTVQEGSTSAHKKCAKGSSTYCIGNSTVYILNSLDQWKVQ